jgi:outer membrane receptor protein involved in Fe transport
VILPDAPTNPFSQRILISFPNSGYLVSFKQKLRTHRLTAGLAMKLAGNWSASSEYSTGTTHVSREKTLRLLSSDSVEAFVYGEPGRPGYPVLDPLGSWENFVRDLERYREPGFQVQPLKNRFRSGNLRVGGPLASLGGGPLTGSAQLEWRRERVPEGEETFRYPLNSSPLDVLKSPINTRRQSVNSAYMELRAPITSGQHPLFVFRDLTLQLALRYDRSTAYFPEIFRSPIDPSNYPTRSERSAVTYTVGGKFSPVPSLIVRGSAATGELPPTIASLDYSISAFRGNKPDLADPRRGNRPAGSEDFLEYLYGGLPESRPERASNISLGAVFNPSGAGGPRISIDYSAISVKREPYRTVPGVFDQEIALAQVPSVLAAEKSDPGRVIRAPLTDEDRALGFDGGVATRIDARGLNEGQSRLQIVELQLDWLLRSVRMGEFRIYGSGTWQPSFERRASAKRPWVEATGQSDGPLEWRAQFGVDWSIGPMSLGLNAHYFGSHRPTRSTAPPEFNKQLELYHAGERIPEQVYFDLTARHRFDLAGRADKTRAVVVQIGIINLADSSPPITADPQSRGYSYHADPRRRRFHLALSSHF